MQLTLNLVNQLNFVILKREEFFILRKSKLNIAFLESMVNDWKNKVTLCTESLRKCLRKCRMKTRSLNTGKNIN